MPRAPNRVAVAEMRRFADMLRAGGVKATFSYAGGDGRPSTPRVKARLEIKPHLIRYVFLVETQRPLLSGKPSLGFHVTVEEYEIDEEEPAKVRPIEQHTTRTVYEAEQMFAQLVAKHRGRKRGPVGEPDERYRVPLPNPSVAPIRADNLAKFGLPATPGGEYLEMPSKRIVTGQTHASGFIDVTAARPAFFVSDERATLPPPRTRGLLVTRTNLFRQRGKWRWLTETIPTAVVGEQHVLVSVENSRGHTYALRVGCAAPVKLETYPEKESEPRLRPTAYVRATVVGRVVGRIRVDKKTDDVYDRIALS